MLKVRLKGLEAQVMSNLVTGMLESQFPYLSERGVEAAYLLMLGMARSANDLERLHGLLPENARLLRPDWLEFKKLWILFFYGDETREGDASNFQNGERISDELARVMLERALTSKRQDRFLSKYIKQANLRSYYLDRLRQDREVHLMDEHGSTSCVWFDMGSPQKWLVRIHNSEFVVHLTHDLQGETRMWLAFWESQLTEPLTYQLSQLPAFFVNVLNESRASALHSGCRLALGYVIPAEPLAEIVQTRDEKNWVNLTDVQNDVIASLLTQAMDKLVIPHETSVYVGIPQD